MKEDYGEKRTGGIEKGRRIFFYFFIFLISATGRDPAAGDTGRLGRESAAGERGRLGRLELDPGGWGERGIWPKISKGFVGLGELCAAPSDPGRWTAAGRGNVGEGRETENVG